MQFKNVLIFLSLISIVRKDKEILFARQRNRHFNYSEWKNAELLCNGRKPAFQDIRM